MLDFFTFAVCAPYSETTDGKHFDALLKLLAANGKTLYQLFRHPSLAIVKVGFFRNSRENIYNLDKK